MNTITIDNNLYSEAILYAEKKRMSIAELLSPLSATSWIYIQ